MSGHTAFTPGAQQVGQGSAASPTGFWPNQPPFLVVTAGNHDGSADLTSEIPMLADNRTQAIRMAKAEARQWRTLGFAVYEMRLVSFHGPGARKWLAEDGDAKLSSSGGPDAVPGMNSK